MSGQLRLEDIEVAGPRWSWVRFGPQGRRALGPDRPGLRPSARDSLHALDHDPSRGRIVTSVTSVRLAPAEGIGRE